MKTFNQTFAYNFFAFFFAMVTMSSFTQAQDMYNRVSDDTQYYASQYESANKKAKQFVIESKARPGMAMGFSHYSLNFADNLRMMNYADGEHNYFVIEGGFGNTVRIKNISTGKYLEVTDDMAINGSTISQGAKRDSRSQLFQLVSLGDNYFALVSQLNYNLGLELSQKGIDFPLILSNRRKSDTQAFKLIRN